MNPQSHTSKLVFRRPVSSILTCARSQATALLSANSENVRYLIHAPYGGREARCGAWRALVEAQQAGKIRSLGVSNYGVHHLNELEEYIKELESENGKGRGGVLSVGQWELHPWLERPDIVEWCRQRNVVLEVNVFKSCDWNISVLLTAVLGVLPSCSR